MANYSYLVCREQQSGSSTQIVASAAYSIPLLWIPLFRPADIVDVSSATLSAETSVVAGRHQLREAIAVLDRLFAAHGSFDELVDSFLRLHERLPGNFVSIELGEIACLSSPGQLTDSLRLATDIFNTPAQELATLISAPLPTSFSAVEIPSLRGKQAVEFIVGRTGKPRRLVERALENCRGDIAKTLDFFSWQGQEARSNLPANEQPPWAVLAELSGVRLHRRFPSVEDGLAGRLSNIDDQWNWAHLVGTPEL